MNQDPFAVFTDDLKSQGKAVDQIPSMDKEVRAIFARVGIPFFIRSVARNEEGKYGPALLYSIDVDVTSREYQASFISLQLSSAYTLWFPATPGRVDQWKLILEGKGIIANQVPLVMAKISKDNGKDMFDFRVYSTSNEN